MSESHGRIICLVEVAAYCFTVVVVVVVVCLFYSCCCCVVDVGVCLSTAKGPWPEPSPQP